MSGGVCFCMVVCLKSNHRMVEGVGHAHIPEASVGLEVFAGPRGAESTEGAELWVDSSNCCNQYRGGECEKEHSTGHGVRR